MSEMEKLNKEIELLWSKLPQGLYLDEKFYSHIETGKLPKLKKLMIEYPLIAEIALADPSIIRGPIYNFDAPMIAYLIGEVGIGVEQPFEKDWRDTLLIGILTLDHTKHRNVNILVEEKFQRKFDSVQTLLKLGANVNVVTPIKGTPLECVIGCFNGCYSDSSMTLLKLLLDSHADPNVQDIQGRTVLHYLLVKLAGQEITFDSLKLFLEQLVQHGADDNIADKNGITPKVLILRYISGMGRRRS